jgi:hypothetical protein
MNSMQYLWNQPSPSPSPPLNANADLCAVCLEVPGTKNVSITACGHIFCTSCLLKSLKTKNTCPTCRAEVEPERSVIAPVSVSVATEIIRNEEHSMNLTRRINAIQSFGGINGRCSMIFSLCRDIAFQTAHGIARWQKTTDQTYHNSWTGFDSDEADDDGSDSD